MNDSVISSHSSLKGPHKMQVSTHGKPAMKRRIAVRSKGYQCSSILSSRIMQCLSHILTPPLIRLSPLDTQYLEYLPLTPSFHQLALCNLFPIVAPQHILI